MDRFGDTRERDAPRGGRGRGRGGRGRGRGDSGKLGSLRACATCRRSHRTISYCRQKKRHTAPNWNAEPDDDSEQDGYASTESEASGDERSEGRGRPEGLLVNFAMQAQAMSRSRGGGRDADDSDDEGGYPRQSSYGGGNYGGGYGQQAPVSYGGGYGRGGYEDEDEAWERRRAQERPQVFGAAPGGYQDSSYLPALAPQPTGTYGSRASYGQQQQQQYGSQRDYGYAYGQQEQSFEDRAGLVGTVGAIPIRKVESSVILLSSDSDEERSMDAEATGAPRPLGGDQRLW